MSTALARREYKHNVEIRWQDAKVVKQVHDVKDLFIAEQLQIFRGSEKGSVINEKKSISISKAWRFALNEQVQYKENGDMKRI